jgi:probable F420-dependent oxidoreductase
MFASAGPFAEPERAAALARAADETNIESIWSVEHVIIPDGYQSRYPYHESGRIPAGEDWDMPDPLIWLGYVAGMTTRITLATGVMILPQRNPLILAKECATLHKLSGGRFRLGVGVGWLEEEFDALGVPFARRGRRTDEYIEAMRALWSQDRAAYDGEFVSFDKAISRPQPEGGSVPVIIGGHSKAAARRAGRLGDGFFPVSATHEEYLELFEVLASSAAEHGRSVDDIEVTVGSWSPRRDSLDRVKELEDLGIDRLIVTPPTATLDGIRAGVEQLAETIDPVATT